MLYIVRGDKDTTVKRTDNIMVAMGYAEAVANSIGRSRILVCDNEERGIRDAFVYEHGYGWYRLMPDKDIDKLFDEWYIRDQNHPVSADK